MELTPRLQDYSSKHVEALLFAAGALFDSPFSVNIDAFTSIDIWDTVAVSGIDKPSGFPDHVIHRDLALCALQIGPASQARVTPPVSDGGRGELWDGCSAHELVRLAASFMRTHLGNCLCL